jgi:hypothetical protein
MKLASSHSPPRMCTPTHVASHVHANSFALHVHANSCGLTLTNNTLVGVPSLPCPSPPQAPSSRFHAFSLRLTLSTNPPCCIALCPSTPTPVVRPSSFPCVWSQVTVPSLDGPKDLRQTAALIQPFINAGAPAPATGGSLPAATGTGASGKSTPAFYFEDDDRWVWRKRGGRVCWERIPLPTRCIVVCACVWGVRERVGVKRGCIWACGRVCGCMWACGLVGMGVCMCELKPTPPHHPTHHPTHHPRTHTHI